MYDNLTLDFVQSYADLQRITEAGVWGLLKGNSSTFSADLEVPLLFEGVGSVGEEFSDEDVAVSVKRLGNYVKKLLGFGLELTFFGGFFCSGFFGGSVCFGEVESWLVTESESVLCLAKLKVIL